MKVQKTFIFISEPQPNLAKQSKQHISFNPPTLCIRCTCPLRPLRAIRTAQFLHHGIPTTARVQHAMWPPIVHQLQTPATHIGPTRPNAPARHAPPPSKNENGKQFHILRLSLQPPRHNVPNPFHTCSASMSYPDKARTHHPSNDQAKHSSSNQYAPLQQSAKSACHAVPHICQGPKPCHQTPSHHKLPHRATERTEPAAAWPRHQTRWPSPSSPLFPSQSTPKPQAPYACSSESSTKHLRRPPPPAPHRSACHRSTPSLPTVEPHQSPQRKPLPAQCAWHHPPIAHQPTRRYC